jgi:hypothetical protein
MPGAAYKALNIEEEPAPLDALPPRLFVIYGNGDAEELIEESTALEALRAAKSDPQAQVVEGEDMKRL